MMLIGLMWLAVLALILFLAFWRGPSLWKWATQRTVWRVSEEGDSLGYDTYNRLTGEQLSKCDEWYIDTGFKSYEARVELLTGWEPDGSVAIQYFGDPPASLVNSPPWVGGATDHYAPMAPWLKLGLTPEKWWEKVGPQDARPLKQTLIERSAAYEHSRAELLEWFFGK